VDPRALADATARDAWLGEMSHSPSELEGLAAAWGRLVTVAGWVHTFDHSRKDLALLKNLTSTLIGRFAQTAEVYQDSGIMQLSVPESTRAEISVLKGIVAKSVMADSARQPIYVKQREMLWDILHTVHENPEHLDAVFAHDWAAAHTASEKQRVVLDQVASLTDQSAMAWHEQLCS